jgi:hypothetical protein
MEIVADRNKQRTATAGLAKTAIPGFAETIVVNKN